MPSSTDPAYCIQIGPHKGGQNFDRRLLSTILDSGTRPYMPGKRATSRVERAIMLLTALKLDRMGAERALLLNREQRRPFVVTQISQSNNRPTRNNATLLSSVSHSLTHSLTQRSGFLRITPPTKRQKPFAPSARVVLALRKVCYTPRALAISSSAFGSLELDLPIFKEVVLLS